MVVPGKDEQDRLLAELRKKATMSAFSRRRMLQGTAMAAAGIGVAGSPAAFAQGDAPNEPQIFFNSSLRTDPGHFDFNADLYAGAEVAVWAGLATFNADGVAVPDWAERWETSDDLSVWTFYIRPDNTGWSNGDPVTAHDFVWSYTRLLSPESTNSYKFILFDVKNGEAYGNQVEGITVDDLGLKALDDWTLEITLEGPRGNFIQKVAYVACVPSHRASVEEHGAEWALGNIPLVSNGPFKLDLWEKGVKVVCSKNPGYWDADNILLETLVDPIIPGANQTNNYEHGTGDQRLDWATLPTADYIRFRDDPELSQQIYPYVYPGVWMLLPSNGVAPFDDIRVRRALQHAIDRNRLVEVTEGLVQPAYQLMPQGVFGFFEDPEITAMTEFDPEKAMAELVGTPYEGGQNWPEITVLIRGNEEPYNSNVMINDIVAQLEENLGFRANIVSLVEQPFRDRLYSNQDQLVWIRWWYDYPDPDNGYFDMFYGNKPAGTKRQAWSNDDFDQIVNDAKAIADPDARLELYKQAEKIMQEDVGYIPIVFRLDVYAFKPWVKGLTVNSQGFTVPDGNIFVRALNDYYIEGRPED